MMVETPAKRILNEACLILNEQTELNYSKALRKAVEDVKKTRDIEES